MSKTILLFLLGLVLMAIGDSSTCTCPDSKINHISALSFGMTLLSPSFSSLYLNDTSKNGFVIYEPSEPIWFAENNYYWDNEYHKAGEFHSTVCSYRIAYHNKELRKIKYNATHRPSNITFGCQWYHECCELGCCMNSILQIVILILLYAGIAMMVVTFCSSLATHADENRRLERARIESGPYLPCRRTVRTEVEEVVENYVLQDMVTRDAPPKYDDLYPNGSPYYRSTPSTSQIPEIVVEDFDNETV